jgi:LuxR family maltose regulon positive regulatory protein
MAMQGNKLFSHQLNLSKFMLPNTSAQLPVNDRLFKRMHEALRQKYVLIQAPQGYGKTSLLGQWCRERMRAKHEQCTIWFRVDTNDTDPSCFWSNLVAALEGCWPDIREAISKSMQIFEHSSIHELLITIANHIAQQCDLDTHYALVMVNFEAFKFSESETQFFMFSHMLPANIHVIISSRIYLTNRLIKQDTYDELSIIGAPELSLTKKELDAFINDQRGKPLKSEYLDKLYAKTEGWPLAVHVFLQTVQPETTIETAIDEFSGHNQFLSEFIFGKMTSDLPPRITSFIIETAFLKHFCAPLCNYVTQTEESDDIIRYLERNGLFTYPLDSEHIWFRYHPLFAEWLQDQALKLRRDLLRSLNHRAGQWYRNEKMLVLSTRYVIAATDNIFVSHLVRFLFDDLTSEHALLLPWLFSLDETHLELEPRFCLLAAWAYVFSGRPNDALDWSKRAVASIDQHHHVASETDLRVENDARAKDKGERKRSGGSNETPPIAISEIREDSVNRRLDLIVRTIEAKCQILQGHNEKGVELSLKILDEMDPLMDGLPRMVLYQSLAEAYEQMGTIEIAMKFYARALTLARANQFEFLTGLARYQVITLFYLQGKLAKTEEMCRLALAECPQDFSVYGALYSLLGLVKIEQNRLDETDVMVQRAFKRVSADRNIDVFLDVCVTYSRYFAACQRYSDAQLQLTFALEEIRRNNDVPPRGVAYRIFVQQARNYLAQNDIASAREVLEEFEHLGFPQTAASTLTFDIMRARIDMTQSEDGDLQTIVTSLQHCIQRAEQIGYQLLKVEALILAAIVSYRLKDSAAATKFIKKALGIAINEHMIRSFIDEGEVARVLLMELLGSGHAGYANESFIRLLLRTFEEERENHGTDPTTDGRQSAAMMNMVLKSERLSSLWNLTSREQEVLRMLQEGLNRKDIAIRFCTSQNTVKTHIAHIYEKIGVHSVPELLRTLMEHNVL